MEHIAIMKKSWGLLPKILSGEKTIESRWYKNKAAPWGRIATGDMVYFKNSGEPITVQSRVKRVMSYEKLTPDKIKVIYERYGKKIGISDYKLFKEIRKKKYCLLIFLEKPEKVKPFEISKKGFGAMAAWLCVKDINKIKLLRNQ